MFKDIITPPSISSLAFPSDYELANTRPNYGLVPLSAFEFASKTKSGATIRYANVFDMAPDITTKMHTLRLHVPGPNPSFSMMEVDTPLRTLLAGEALVRIVKVGVCGSDLEGIFGKSGRRNPADTEQGLTLGHEASGIIVAVTKEAYEAGLRVGQRVTFDSTHFCGACPRCTSQDTNFCDSMQVFGAAPQGGWLRHGAMAEYLAVPARGIFPLPDSVSFEQAAMVEPLAVGVQAIRYANLHPDEPVLVVGSGLIGGLLLQSLKAEGIKHVMAVDADPKRIKLAKECGASVTFQNQILQRPEFDVQFLEGNVAQAKALKEAFGRNKNVPSEIRKRVAKFGFMKAIEIVGPEATVGMGLMSLEKGGTLIAVGNTSAVVRSPHQAIVTRGLSEIGSCAAIRQDYNKAIRFLSRGKVHPEKLITHRCSLKELPEVIASPKGALKIMVAPQEGHPTATRKFFQ